MFECAKLGLILGIAVVGCCWSIQLQTNAPKLRRYEHRIQKRQNNPSCASYEFKCDNTCVNKTKTCDGFFDCTDEADESWDTCHERSCVSSRFRCKSGGCIHKNKLCDGFLSCVDGDDESIEVCRNNVCPPEKFRCSYGGCIRMHRVCNGDSDCTDGSDEDQDFCAKRKASSASPVPTPTPVTAPPPPPRPSPSAPVTTTTTTTTTNTPAQDSSQCTVPPFTPDKTFTINCPIKNKPCGQKPSEFVQEYSALQPRCNKDFAHYHAGRIRETIFASTCLNGSWEPPVGVCKKICNRLHSSDLNLICHQSLNGLRIPCTGVLLQDSIVIPSCKPQYHPNYIVNHRYVKCLKDGTWDKELLQCSPDCGKTPSSSVDLIVNGTREKRGEAPWNVAIYRGTADSEEPQFICGGTLISAELLVSAAHCFYDSSLEKTLDARLFFVVVGKSTLEFKKADYPTTKTYSVKRVILPDVTAFTGPSTNYASDIAILQLSDRITLSGDVLPACLYWEDRDRFSPRENVAGKLSGFGATENGSLAPVLLTANLPYISYADCLNKVSENFKDSISVDKFCAGHVTGAGARVGDSGGGLVFKDKKNGFFYLRGVVSNKDTTSSSIATFTDVALYIAWIKRVSANVEQSALNEDTIVNLKSKVG